MIDQTSSPAATTPAVKDRVSPAKLVKWGIALLVLGTLVGFGIHFWRQSQLFVSTDNAYVNANRIVTTVLAHQSQIIWSELGAHVTQYNDALVEYLRHMRLATTDPRGLAVVAREVWRQAQMSAMLDVFALITVSYVAMMPLVFLLKRSTAQRAGPVPRAALAE